MLNYYTTLYRLQGFSLLAILLYLVIFLPLFLYVLYFSCLASALERSRSYVFDVQKKKVEVSETAFWCLCLLFPI